MNTFCKKKNHAKQPKHLRFAGAFLLEVLMKQKYKLRHRFTALLMAFMLCLSCFAAPSAFAMESSSSEPASMSEANSAVESQTTPEKDKFKVKKA